MACFFRNLRFPRLLSQKTSLKAIASTFLFYGISSHLSNSTLINPVSFEDDDLGGQKMALGDPDAMTEQVQEYLKQMFEIALNPIEDYIENQIYEHTVYLEDRKIKVLVFKYNGIFYATGAYNPYDFSIELKDGLLLHNKLMCPITGSAFNIETGEPEYGPATDCLPIFQTTVIEGKLVICLPKNPPIKIRPNLSPRDFADMRKVIIIGGGPAAYSTAENLRQMSYTGELTMVTDKACVPFNKDKFRKSIKHATEKDFEMRPEEWYDDFGINILFASKASSFLTRKKNYFLEISGHNYELEYDALCVAVGSKPHVKKIYRSHGKKNVFFFNHQKNHARLKKILEGGGEKVILLGCCLESLE
jgi:nitrite reductase/ring-hydroxylating ferredoxin subunit